MSHFSVLVVTKEKPTEEVLTKTLQPFHEFECTGADDQFVQNLDVLDEYLSEYNSKETTRYVDSSGGIHCPYSDQFYRDPSDEETEKIGPIAGTGCGGDISWSSRDWGDGRGYRPKIHYMPEGFREVTMPLRECESFAEWVTGWHGKTCVQEGEPIDLSGEHKYGYCVIDASGKPIKCIRRTNPNAQWDYWRVGGRYRSKLQVLTPTAATVSTEPSWEWREEKELPDGFDQCQMCDLDMLHMKNAAMRQREQWVSECLTKTGLTQDEYLAAYRLSQQYNALWLTMEEPRPRGSDYGDAMERWLVDQGHSANNAEKAKRITRLWETPDIDSDQTIDDWINAAVPLTTFAVLKDGQWYQRGEMGWWGVTTNEDDQWEKRYPELLASIHPDHYLTVVDCHI